MAGRKPTGPPLVQHLDGSEQAKDRLEVILETVAGKTSIAKACDRLHVKAGRFFQLRAEVLQAALARLEPRPAGRPPRQLSAEELRIAELERELQDSKLQQKATETRLTIAQIMPQLTAEAPKKTNPPPPKRPARRRRRRK